MKLFKSLFFVASFSMLVTSCGDSSTPSGPNPFANMPKVSAQKMLEIIDTLEAQFTQKSYKATMKHTDSSVVVNDGATVPISKTYFGAEYIFTNYTLEQYEVTYVEGSFEKYEHDEDAKEYKAISYGSNIRKKFKFIRQMAESSRLSTDYDYEFYFDDTYLCAFGTKNNNYQGMKVDKNGLIYLYFTHTVTSYESVEGIEDMKAQLSYVAI